MEFPNFVPSFLLSLVVCTFIIRNGAEAELQTARDRGFPIPQHGGERIPKFWNTANEGRLPTSVIPTNYELQIQPVLNRSDPIFGTFFGMAFGALTITIDCVNATNTITLHVNTKYVNVNDTAVLVETDNGNNIPILHKNRTNFDFYIIELNQTLAAGETYKIIFNDFTTTIATDRYDGLYLTNYLTPGETEPSLIAVTTLAASAARQVFPCFDEPAMKATFDITIGRGEGFISLSNTEMAGPPLPFVPGWFYDTYNTTVKMSTYLAIVFVANYNFTEAALKLPGDKPVRVYAPPYMIAKHGADYAVNVSQKVMTFFEEYFDIDYKLNKYDSAAIPDFQFGAMENYGLVTYKTPFLMYFEDETTETERKRISSIIAHESSHQWFGNLITAKWWNHIWLNEGFASYLAPIGVKHTDPEFEPEKGFQNDIFQYVMPFDSDPSYAHPILSSDTIDAPFYDRINYEKGACMIRMMEGFLTANTLKVGLQKFLKAWAFEPVEQNDLFTILTEEAHNDGVLPMDLTVQDIMDSWTQQAGFPLVKVSAAGPNSVYVSQERFVSLTLNGEDKSREWDPNDLWHIPISLATKSSPDFNTHFPAFWLPKDVQLRTRAHNTSEWIMLNLDGIGFYRVLYDYTLFQLILEQLATDPNIISPLSRSQLIDDYFKSAFQSHTNIENALDLTKYLENERDAHVWDSVLTNFEYIFRMLLGNDVRAHLVPKLEAALTDVGLDQLPTDKGNIVLYRLQLLDWACAMDSVLCVNHAKELFTKWRDDPTNDAIIPLDLQPVIYCAAIANDIEQSGSFDFARQKYSEAGIPEHQKSYLLNALACSREVFQLTGLLEAIISTSSPIFPDSDSRILLQKITSNSHGRAPAFTFIRENLDAFIAKFDVEIIAETITTMASFANTPGELGDIENFINANVDQFESIAVQLRSALNSMERNIEWMNKYSGRIKEWLEDAKN